MLLNCTHSMLLAGLNWPHGFFRIATREDTTEKWKSVDHGGFNSRRLAGKRDSLILVKEFKSWYGWSWLFFGLCWFLASHTERVSRQKTANKSDVQSYLPGMITITGMRLWRHCCDFILFSTSRYEKFKSFFNALVILSSVALFLNKFIADFQHQIS